MAAMLLQEPVIQTAIWDALNNYCYKDATFLAERLVAEVKTSDEALFLLATCYYRMGKSIQAYMLLQKRGCPTPQCKYLLARCCVDLNKLSEAEEVLVGSIFQSKTKSCDELEAEFSGIACHVFSLLGHIYSKTERQQKAIECYKKSLKLNPLMWSSFEQLCELGDKTEPCQVFKAPPHSQITPVPQVVKHMCSPNWGRLDMMEFLKTPDTLQQHTLCESKSQQTPFQGQGTPFTPSFANQDSPSQLMFVTPSPALTDSNTLESRAPSKKPVTRRSQQTGIQNNPPVVRKRTVKENKSPRGTGRNPKKNIVSGLGLGKTDLTSDTGTKPLQSDTPSQTQILQIQHQSLCGMLNLLQSMGRAYQALSQYDCRKAIECFQDLPLHHYNTGYVLCKVGRAYFELAQYQKAERVFSEVRSLEPHHLDGLEIHSTTLWHLQKDVELSTLAQELSDMDKSAPQAWCAMGNCFSLQREHDTAIKFFQRAIQVDPSFAYAYTLLGHEYVFTEELDKAMSCFRNAIRVNPRHYNAWYGVGMIYFKQEKFTLAEVHYRKALLINPQSPALLCHIGVVQHSQQKSESALVTLNKAIETDPTNPLCKFHRASILFASERHKEALQELEELKQIVPKESLVYFLIGKVHKKLGNSDLALMNFSWAMDLDPKGINNHETGPD
ncbi:cell division cycle protein 27 homolog isoform X1 [Pecten maximus]|uniref:cell division cycle protein 27 homolog isoform X1 n=1 Tax=Pecten maximus TaxID=6579 RepID=UPI00145801D7|nr:cell division cycle protein 27 homolog isoform X1 [Pecten maximus]XP_033728257.1 cell division cycle protein 27 homolog isoform X1 [Pecten maximus]